MNPFVQFCKQGRAAVALLALGLGPAARAQSPWVTMPTAPSFSANASISVSPHALVALGGGVLWVKHGYTASRVYASTLSRTIDNGLSWQGYGVSVGYNSGTEIVDYSVATQDVAWVLTHQLDPAGPYFPYFLLRTTSGPAGFAFVPGTLPAAFTQIHFFDTTTGIALAAPVAGANNQRLFRTADAGATWTLMPNAAISSDFYIVKRTLRGNQLWLAAPNGKIAYTIDQGLTWNTATTGLTTGPNVYLNGLVFRDANNGLAYTTSSNGGGRQLARTSDGGRTWTVLPNLWPADILSIVACPSATGTYYVGVGSTVTYNPYVVVATLAVSTDDGASWQPRAADNHSYHQLAASDNGQLWASAYNYPTGSQPNAMLFRNNGVALPVRADAVKAVPAAFPNPSTGLVSLAHEAGSTVRVYDSAGRQYACPEQAGKFDLSAARRGLYFFRVTAADGHSYTQRVAVVE